MTVSRSIKRSYVIVLFSFGLCAIFGLGFLMYKVLPRVAVWDPGVLVLLPVVVVIIIAALFVFGVFLGYFYRNPTAIWLINKKTRAQFRNALTFERGERIRLERELHETKQAMANLKERLADASRMSGEGSNQEMESLLLKIEKEKNELEEKHDRLREDLMARKQRIADLMTDIAIAQAEAEEARDEVKRLKTTVQPNESGRLEPKIATEDASIRDVLASVTSLDGVKMAVVTDDFGLVVESSDANLDIEQLAAASSIMSQIASRLKGILPIGEISKISVGDDEGLVLDVTYFNLFDLRCCLTIVRSSAHDYPGLAEQTIEAIVSRLQ